MMDAGKRSNPRSNSEPPPNGGGEIIEIVRTKQIYVPLHEVLYILKVNRWTLLSFGFGTSVLTVYFSNRDPRIAITGIVIIFVGILIDQIFLERKIKDLESKKEKAKIAPLPR